MSAPEKALIPTRESLLNRLKEWGNQESWHEFFNTYGKLIYGFAVKAGCSDVEAQDVVQETMLSVAKEIPDFKYDPSKGSFKAWLLRITQRRIIDQHRKRQSALHPFGSRSQTSSELDDRTDTIERIPDPSPDALEAEWDKEWRRNLFDQAMARVKRQVSPKQFQMFDLYVTQNWPMPLIISTLGVSAAQVYMAKMRVSALLKKQIRTLQTGGI